MSRSGYIDDMDDQWALIRWRGAVSSAIKGRRGQNFLKEMLAALDSLSQKKLIARELQDEYDGSVCAIGAVGKARGIDMTNIDPEDSETVAALFGISDALAKEIVYINDDWLYKYAPEDRFLEMRKWIQSRIKQKEEPK